MIISEIYKDEVPILREMVMLYLRVNRDLLKEILNNKEKYKNNKQAKELLNALEICNVIEYACKISTGEEEQP